MCTTTKEVNIYSLPRWFTVSASRGHSSVPLHVVWILMQLIPCRKLALVPKWVPEPRKLTIKLQSTQPCVENSSEEAERVKTQKPPAPAELSPVCVQACQGHPWTEGTNQTSDVTCQRRDVVSHTTFRSSQCPGGAWKHTSRGCHK